MNLGLLFATDTVPAASLGGFARAAEAHGLASLWVPELFGRDPFVTAAALLAATTTLRVGTGIANVYARDALATRAAAATLVDLYGERFELGLGVSNAEVNRARGHAWEPPVAKLGAYFDAMLAAPVSLRVPAPPVYLAAHGPKLLGFAGARADGANVYLMTREYVREARALLGSDKRLNLVLHAFVCADPVGARARARKAIAIYRGLSNYHRAWRAMGFADADFLDEASDAFVDELFAWGDTGAVRARLGEFLAAGVDRIMVIPHNLTERGVPDLDVLGALAP